MGIVRRAAAASRRRSRFAAGILLLVALTACGSGGRPSSAHQTTSLPSATTTVTSPAATSGVAAPLAGRGGTVPIKVVTAANAALALVPVSIDGKGPFVFALDTGGFSVAARQQRGRAAGLQPAGTPPHQRCVVYDAGPTGHGPARPPGR